MLYLRQERIGEPSVGVKHTHAMWSAVDLDGVSARALVTTPGTASYYGRAGGRDVIFRPDFIRHAFAAPASGGFVLSLSDQPRIDHYGPEGDLLRSIRFPEDAVSGEIADAQSHRLGPGEPWLFSDRDHAHDSRYFGPVHEAHVVAVLQPWWMRW